jgi:hypothetical protein
VISTPSRCAPLRETPLRGMKIITLAFFFVLSASIAAAQILLNPDFEDGIAPWERVAISGIRPWSIGSADPQSGEFYVFTFGEASLTQTFGPVSVSLIESMFFWVDRENPATLYLELLYDGGTTSTPVEITSDTDSGWGLFDATDLLQAGRSLSGIRIIKLGSGTVRLDNFNLILNKPELKISLSGENIVINFLGILQESTDLVAWEDIDPQPESPLRIPIEGTSRFFRARMP